MAWTLFVTATVLLALGVPVAFSLAAAALLAVAIDDRYSAIVVLKEMFTGIDSFPLLAVPFFILAAELMTGGKLTEVLLRFASQFVGHRRGGLRGDQSALDGFRPHPRQVDSTAIILNFNDDFAALVKRP